MKQRDRAPLTFEAATDLLKVLGVTQREIAAALGVSLAAVKQARVRRASPSHRQPPIGWQRTLAALARERARGLEDAAARIGRS